MADTLIGFAPSFYFNQQSAGLGIWIATGTINGVQYNGQFVSIPKMATSYVSISNAGVISVGSSSVEPAGSYLLAQVVAGQVVTSGNTVASSPFGGTKGFKPSFGNTTTNDGILSITDLRSFI